MRGGARGDHRGRCASSRWKVRWPPTEHTEQRNDAHSAGEIDAARTAGEALRNEVASLRQENKELWAAIAELRRTAAQ